MIVLAAFPFVDFEVAISIKSKGALQTREKGGMGTEGGE